MDDQLKDKGGRPTSYSTDVAAEICVRLSAGESLRSICKDDHMPADSTVRAWAIADIDGFHAHYTRAREAQMDALAEDILEMADNDKADVQRSRLQVDTRKWLMSKIAPKRFGDKKTHEVSGPNGAPISVVDLTNMTEEQLAALETVFGPLAGGSGNDDEADQSGEEAEG